MSLRELPRDQRAAVGRAIRAGRAVDDPRLAAYAVEQAERLARHGRWLRFFVPRRRLYRALHLLTLVSAYAAVAGVLHQVLPHHRLLADVAAAALVVYNAGFAIVVARWARNAARAVEANRALLDAAA